jgi:hypothetical protein
MFDAAPYTLIPAVTEPTPEARFREELAGEPQGDPADTESAGLLFDPELVLACHLSRLGRFIRFS